LGEWFLEEHHVVPLPVGGPDIIENTVALCPNCHRKCHLSPEADTVQKELRNTIERIE
jgi:5-methylcytosine-specific restriction protein A